MSRGPTVLEPVRRRRRRAPALIFFGFALGLAVLIGLELLLRAAT